MSARRFILLAIAFAVAAIAIGRAGVEADLFEIPLTETLEQKVGDWFIVAAAPAAEEQDQRIAVVLIGDEALLDYPYRSPINRRLLAEVVRLIDAAEPAAIGIDIVFDRRTADDAQLLEAIENAKAPVVLGVLDERLLKNRQSIELQAEFIDRAGRPFGHLLFEHEPGTLATTVDRNVRRIASAEESGSLLPIAEAAPCAAENGKLRPFTDVLLCATGRTAPPWNRLIGWSKRPLSGAERFAELELPQHDPADLTPVRELLGSDYMGELLAGRIILIGGAMNDSDLHQTPFTVTDGRLVRGVLIHAEALAQRLDGREIAELDRNVAWALASALAAICIVIAYRFGLKPRGLVYSFIGLLLIGILGIVTLRYGDLALPTLALATAWVGGAAFGLGARRVTRQLP